MRTVQIIVGANKRVNYGLAGTFIKIESLSGPSTITLNVFGQPLDVKTDSRVRWPVRFKEIDFDNSANGTQATIVISVGEGEKVDGQVSSQVTNVLPVSATPDSQPDVVLATASSQDYAADATAREYIFTAAKANTLALRIRDQSGTTDEGVPLEPGATVVITTSGALRVRNNTGASQTFSVFVSKV